MNPRLLVAPAVSLVALVFAACSSGGSDTGGGQGGTQPGSGGAVGAGGTQSSNGGTTGAGGAVTGAGGATSNSAGGAVGSGGATGVGGSMSSGGTAGSGTSNGGSAGKASSGGTSSGSGGSAGAASTGAKFSFFVTSIGAMRELSKNDNGFGGDLRFGEADGLAGADKICRTIAEKAMPGAGSKTWRAFLSTVAGPVHAIDRIGEGPWYDRLGRLVAANKTDLVNTRPVGADPAIINDLPNENGIPNHQDGAPGCSGNNCPDNHDILTGTGPDGKLHSTAMTSTCNDWTSSDGSAPAGTGGGSGTGTGGRSGGGPGGGFMMGNGPWCGHSWPRMGSGENWMSALAEGGCAPGVNLVESGGNQPGVYTVGTGGGYGGIYCFALTP